MGRVYNKQGSGGNIDCGDIEVVGMHPSADGWVDAGHFQNQAGLLQNLGGE